MKRIVVPVLSAAVAFVVLINFSCSKSSSSNGGGNNGGPDSILINIGNNIILPAYQALNVSVNSLDSAIIDFNAAPNSTKLTAVQALFKNAYVAWQSASEYNGFGPASTASPILGGLNLFPASTTLIDNNIASGNMNINSFANAAAKGFGALDYLLFGGNALVNYTSDVNAANRKLYLATVSADVKTEVNAVVKAWLPGGGNYINTFINSTGNSIASSLGLLINSVDLDFEILKNDRLGIPLGKQAQGTALPVAPTEVEAYYSGISAQLAFAQLKAVQGIYLGTGEQGNGRGLRDYLVKANAKYNGGPLSDTITAHFATAVSELQAIPDPFSATIQANPAPAGVVYVETQKLVVLLKTDMPSSLGVLITYGDNDGD